MRYGIITKYKEEERSVLTVPKKSSIGSISLSRPNRDWSRFCCGAYSFAFFDFIFGGVSPSAQKSLSSMTISEQRKCVFLMPQASR